MSGPSASSLNDRAEFLAPQYGRDPDGNPISGYALQFSIAAGVLPLRGSESVMQARMKAKTPVIITVRVSIQSLQIVSDWKVSIRGREYDIKEEPRMTVDRRFLEFLAEA